MHTEGALSKSVGGIPCSRWTYIRTCTLCMYVCMYVCLILYVHLQTPAAWATLGHIHYLSGDLKEAQPAFERALAFVGDCPEVHSVHLRLGDIYLKSNQASHWAFPSYVHTQSYHPDEWHCQQRKCRRSIQHLEYTQKCENLLASVQHS